MAPKETVRPEPVEGSNVQPVRPEPVEGSTVQPVRPDPSTASPVRPELVEGRTPGRSGQRQVEGSNVSHPDLGDSIEVMRKAHEGQVDKCGRPYYLHPLRAAMRLGHCTMEERHAALLHDVVEDTLVTLQNLREMGYGEEVLGLVDLLTRRKPEGESHNQYIERIVASGNVKALRVKLADVYDNMSPARTRALPSHQRGIRHRFARDAERVETALRELGDELHTTIVKGDL